MFSIVPEHFPNDGRSEARLVVTPEMAQIWLKRNVANFRNPRWSLIGKLVCAIKAGRWQYNAQSISFNEKGELSNGQNRLHAIKEAEIPCELLVCIRVPDKSTVTVDCGTQRCAADYLAHRGIHNATTNAAAARWVFSWFSGAFHDLSPGQLPVIRSPTPDDVNRIVDICTGLPEASARTVAAKVAGRVLTPGVGAFLGFVYSLTDMKEDWERFFSRVDKGEGLAEGEGAWLLRAAFVSVAGTRSGRSRQKLHQHMNPVMRCALALKAFQLERNQRRHKWIRWITEGPFAEHFPSLPRTEDLDLGFDPESFVN
jgi:hypothetical protein